MFLGLNYAFSDGGIGGPAYINGSLTTKSLYISLLILIFSLIFQAILLFIKVNNILAIIVTAIILITALYSLCINFAGHQMYIAAIISTILFQLGNSDSLINKNKED
ncbi:hypothetical protein [Apilactobacillus micheneri]|uniref:hypothetical protein n=1 Tax=Apilactobacillus micheneri TaxID=1899430 RepID=UPI001127ECC1|nr:hypothetical protein [Apilactobacillus micheneri]TPR42712.1 hypothetical protein DY123_01610 [Apilactobacillus micheneri]TPR52516.1 hypothetical protein DY126_01615 [Apilactobacillus micheneri]